MPEKRLGNARARENNPVYFFFSTCQEQKSIWGNCHGSSTQRIDEEMRGRGSVVVPEEAASSVGPSRADSARRQVQEKRRGVRDAAKAEYLEEFRSSPTVRVREPAPRKRWWFAAQRRYLGCCYAKDMVEAVVDADCDSIARQVLRARLRDAKKIRSLGGVERAEAFCEDESRGFVGVATRLANAYDAEGRTPLSLAIKEARPDVAEALLHLQANPNKADDWTRQDRLTGATPMLSSILADLPGVAVELARRDADCNAPDRNGMTPLMLAALVGDHELCDMLLENKAEPDARDAAGWTPLIYAAYAGSLDCVKSVLAAGANPRLRDDAGHTARDWAAYMRLKAKMEPDRHGRCEAYLEAYRPKLNADSDDKDDWI